MLYCKKKSCEIVHFLPPKFNNYGANLGKFLLRWPKKRLKFDQKSRNINVRNVTQYNKTQFSVKVILYSNYQAINFRVSKGQNTMKYYL